MSYHSPDSLTIRDGARSVKWSAILTMVGIAGRAIIQLYLIDRMLDLTGRTIYDIDRADYIIAQLAITHLYLTNITFYLTGKTVYVTDRADYIITLLAITQLYLTVRTLYLTGRTVYVTTEQITLSLYRQFNPTIPYRQSIYAACFIF